MTKYERNIKVVFFRFEKYLCKAFSNFDFNSTIKKNTLGFAIVWKYVQRKVFVN